MSPSTAYRVGRSFSRWIGINGNNCLIAQLSGIDWNSEKLQKYVSDKQRIEPLQFLRHKFHLLRQLLDFVANGPIQILDHAALIERQITVGEQRHRVIQRLLGVVIAFQNIAHAQVLVGFHQIGQRLLRLPAAICGGMPFCPCSETPSTPNTSTL